VPRSKESPQQATEALDQAAQQSEDAGEKPTYCAAEAAENAHLTSAVRHASGTRAIRRDT
jgi:hypothetical protein